MSRHVCIIQILGIEVVRKQCQNECVLQAPGPGHPCSEVKLNLRANSCVNEVDSSTNKCFTFVGPTSN